MKAKALGRGLSALIPGADNGENEENFLQLSLRTISENPFQPRESMEPESLRELAESIKENGVIQPIAVCKRDGGYLLISGARRVKAAKIAGLKTIPAMLIEIESDEQFLELAIVENLQREDLNPIELALGYKRLMDDCNLTQEEIAQKVGKGRPTVANTLRLLKLPAKIQQAVRSGELSMGHARALISVEDEESVMTLFNRVVKEGMNVRQLEKTISSGKAAKPMKKAAAEPNPYLSDIESRLRNVLATKVSVNSRSKGGVIEISYFSAEELERLIELLESLNEI